MAEPGAAAAGQLAACALSSWTCPRLLFLLVMLPLLYLLRVPFKISDSLTSGKPEQGIIARSRRVPSRSSRTARRSRRTSGVTDAIPPAGEHGAIGRERRLKWLLYASFCKGLLAACGSLAKSGV